MPRLLLAILVLTFGALSAAGACDLCIPQGSPWSEEKARAPVVVFGRIVKSIPDARGRGSSELAIDHVIKDHEAIKGVKSLVLDTFVPVSEKVKYLVFVDVVDGKLDPYRPIAVSTDRVVEYLKHAKPNDPKADSDTRVARLRYFFDYLHDPDPLIALDAFREWAIARNEDVGRVAKTLDPKKLRPWLADKKTPAVRLSLYGFLLGACGTEEDAKLLLDLIHRRDDRSADAIAGLLAGYIALKPNEGWALALKILDDSQRQLVERINVLRMLRFFHDYQLKEARPHILAAARVMIDSPEMIDLIVEQLRGWGIWDLTEQILAKYRKKEAPIVRRALIRYALSCPLDAAKQFIREREQDPDERETVDEVREGLKRS